MRDSRVTAVLGAAFFLFSSSPAFSQTAAAPRFSAQAALSRFQALAPGWTEGLRTGKHSAPESLKAWERLFDMSDPRERLQAAALGAAYAAEEVAAALEETGADEMRGIAQALLAEQARREAAEIAGAREKGLDARLFDLTALQAAFGDSIGSGDAALGAHIEQALSEGRSRQSESVREEQFRRVSDWMKQARVLDLRQRRRIQDGLRELAARPDPLASVLGAVAESHRASGGKTGLFRDDGTRDPDALRGLEVMGQRVSRMGVDELAVLGKLHRAAQAAKWEPIRLLAAADRPKEFLKAVDGLLGMAQRAPALGKAADQAMEQGRFGEALRDAGASNRTRHALVDAALVAEEKPFASYHGKLEDATEAFAAYLAKDPRNSKDFIESRQYEFRDHLAVLLLFAEGLRFSRLRDAGAAPSEREAALRGALADATGSFLRGARGILSFSRLPLSGAIDIVFPLLSPALRESPAALESVLAGFADARRTPVGEAYRVRKPLWRNLVSQAAILAVPLALMNFFLFSFPSVKGMVDVWTVLLLNGMTTVLGYLQTARMMNPPVAYQVRDWRQYRAATARLRELLGRRGSA